VSGLLAGSSDATAGLIELLRDVPTAETDTFTVDGTSVCDLAQLEATLLAPAAMSSGSQTAPGQIDEP
jgi:hypothetical protein